LNHRSGLLGVSGVSPDYATVEAAAREGNARARLALDMFADRVRSAVAAMAVAMGGVDALIFHRPGGREFADHAGGGLRRIGVSGTALDGGRNAACRPDADVAAVDSSARILVIHTREELMIGREAIRVAEEARALARPEGVQK